MPTIIQKIADDHGLRITEATKPIIIAVNQRDVNKARVKDPGNCAFACAVKRSHPEIKAAYFFRSCAYLEKAGQLVKYLLPESVQKEIVVFDRVKEMEPGNYHLQPVSPSQRLATKREDKRARRSTGESGIKRTMLHRTTKVRTMFVPSLKLKGK